MMGLCKHNQSGFCKFGENCQNRHINEICDKETCENCELRHPKRCKYFIYNRACKFGDECAYRHDESVEMLKIHDLEIKLKEAVEKIDNLQRFVHEMTNDDDNTKTTESRKEAFDSIEDSEEKTESSFKCELCDFTSTWKTGLEVHMGRKHKSIPQLDGEDFSDNSGEDESYEGSKHYWKTRYLGQAYQSFMDAQKVIEESDFSKEAKEMETKAILEARKVALGDNYKYFPPWD